MINSLGKFYFLIIKFCEFEFLSFQVHQELQLFLILHLTSKADQSWKRIFQLLVRTHITSVKT